MSTPKTLLITGISSGLGRAVAEAALARGHRVVGTLRQETQRRAFEAAAPGRAIGRLLDVTDTAAVCPLIRALEAEVRPLDVLVNNAGYGLQGLWRSWISRRCAGSSRLISSRPWR